MSLRQEPYWLIGLALAAGIAIVLTGESLGEVETVEALQARLRLAPNDASLHERLGHVLLRDHRPTESLPHFDFAIAANPKNTTAPNGKARALAALNRGKEAQDTLKASLKERTDDAPNNELLADFLSESLAALGDDIVIPATEKYYEAALRSDPTSPRAAVAISKRKLAQGDTETAGRILERPLLSYPRDAALNLQMAAVYAAVKNINAAQQYFDKGTAFDPKNATAYCDYGQMLVDFGRFNAAERALHTSLDLDPKNPRTHVLLARTLREQALMNRGKMEDSFKEIEAALNLNIRYAPAYFELARTHLVQKDDARAKYFFQQAVNFDPMYADALRELAHVQMYSTDSDVRDPAAGLVNLKLAVDATHWRDLGLMIALGRALAEANQFDAAVDVMDRAIPVAQSSLSVEPKERELVGELRLQYQLKTLPPDTREKLPLEMILPVDPLATDPWPKAPRMPQSYGPTQYIPITLEPAQTQPAGGGSKP